MTNSAAGMRRRQVDAGAPRCCRRHREPPGRGAAPNDAARAAAAARGQRYSATPTGTARSRSSIGGQRNDMA